MSEDEGNGNGVPEAGEDIDLDISLLNNTGIEATNVEARLLVLADDVEILDGYEDYGTMSNGETKSGDFQVRLNFAYTTAVDFTLQVTFKKNILELSYTPRPYPTEYV